jgi:hypothetical protein
MSHDDVRVTHLAELHGVRFSGHLCGSRKSRMSSNVQRVLGEIGQSVRPMSEAPRDGRKILGKSARGVVICYWDAKPFKLAGPIWVEAPDADRGYIDKHFTGWVEPAKLKLLDYATLAELLIAYVDDAQAAGDTRALKILDRRAMAD